MVSSLLGDVQRCLPVVVLHCGVGAGPEQQSHALALVLNDAVMERGVSLTCLAVQRGGILHQEVDDVEGVAGLVGDGVMKARLGKFLKNRLLL